MHTFIWIVHILAALALIGLVLIQHGKGADVGAAFGSGSAGSLFGAAGAANFLSRATAIAAAVFFAASLGLTYFSGRSSESVGVMQGVASEPAKPAAKLDSKGTAPPPAPAQQGQAPKPNDIPK